jgi:lipid-A-disaccharide synthase
MVAGEASGDEQASRLAAAMLARDPSLEIYGAGGAAMRAAGVATIVDTAELSIMGVSELGGSLRRVWRAYRRLVAELHGPRRPDLVVLVDFPDFNLRIAKVAHRAGVPVLYYVSPQVWAWRRGRIRKICRRVDRLIALFPFEVELYRAHGLDARFVGHPLAEDVRATRGRDETRRLHGLPLDRHLVALLPGSRAKEVRAVLPVMLGAAGVLAGRAAFAIARAPGLATGVIEELVSHAGVDVAIVERDTYNLLAASDAAAVTSGTATVECALLGCPMVVVYRMSRTSFAVARTLVRVPHIAMPNLILGGRVVPELVQAEATADHVAAELARYLDSGEHRERVAQRLAEIRHTLVVPGAAARAAELALEMLA